MRRGISERRGLSRQTYRRIRPILETMEDRLLLATFTVNGTADDGSVGTLRWAIGQSNATAGSNLIKFAIGGAGVHTIAVTSALPAITVPVTIDGTSQTGYAGSPLIELNGTAQGQTPTAWTSRRGARRSRGWRLTGSRERGSSS